MPFFSAVDHLMQECYALLFCFAFADCECREELLDAEIFRVG